MRNYFSANVSPLIDSFLPLITSRIDVALIFNSSAASFKLGYSFPVFTHTTGLHVFGMGLDLRFAKLYRVLLKLLATFIMSLSDLVSR